MPEKVKKAIMKEYEKKGKSPKDAESIAYAIMTKEGIYKHKKK